jgi:hypothetical protein
MEKFERPSIVPKYFLRLHVLSLARRFSEYIVLFLKRSRLYVIATNSSHWRVMTLGLSLDPKAASARIHALAWQRRRQWNGRAKTLIFFAPFSVMVIGLGRTYRGVQKKHPLLCAPRAARRQVSATFASGSRMWRAHPARIRRKSGAYVTQMLRANLRKMCLLARVHHANVARTCHARRAQQGLLHLHLDPSVYFWYWYFCLVHFNCAPHGL